MMNIWISDGPEDLPTREVAGTSRVWTIDPEGDPAIEAQLTVMLQALSIYDDKNKDYKDNWVRMGWRGLLIRIRERSDRLWDKWWDREQAETRDEDDALDLINFAAFFVRAQRNGMTTRDGQWWN